MGLWKDTFHWRVVLGWDVLAWTVGTLLAVGALVLVFDQYALANICFMLTAAVILAKITQLAAESGGSVIERLLFVFLLFGILGIGVVETIRGVNRWAQSKRESAVTTSVAQERPTISGTPQPRGNESPTTSASANTNQTIPREDKLPSVSPIEGLAELGWTVQPGTDEIQFEVVSKQLPDMNASARYFKLLHKSFRLHLQSVKGIEGLHFLADISECKSIEINAGEFTDISELRGFTKLTKLFITQLPLTGP